LSTQGIKSGFQKIKWTGDRRGDALPEARRAPPWQGRDNATQAAFSWPYGARAPGLWARGRPPGPLSPGAYKYPPGVFSWERSRAL